MIITLHSQYVSGGKIVSNEVLVNFDRVCACVPYTMSDRERDYGCLLKTHIDFGSPDEQVISVTESLNEIRALLKEARGE